LEGGAPDLRNLIVYYEPCNQDDVIIMVSDGVHDNLDPQQLGKTPHDLGISLKENSWKYIEKLKSEKVYEESEKMKTQYSLKFLNMLLSGDQKLGMLVAMATNDVKVPAAIVNKLLDHCVKLTKSSRDFLEGNPGKRLPVDYETYPGNVPWALPLIFR
jgi:hypothetical protein